MDPAILNYLQSQQQPNQMSNMGQAPQQQTPYNPFDTGIRAAINSARESLGMTQKQQDKALRSSMLSFANNIAQQPREKGFWNNVGQVGRALEPAIGTYDQEENTALNENNALGNQILKYQGAEQDRQAKAEEQAFWRSHAQEQLGEARRNNNLLDNFRQQKLQNDTGQEGQFGPDFIPISSTPVKNGYVKEKKLYGTGLKHVNDTIANVTNLEDKYKDDKIPATGPFSPITAPVQNFFGIMRNNKELKEKSAEIENLNSELVELKAGLERTLKGGVLGPKILEYFDREKVYPTISDTTETRNKKLATIQQKMNELYEASDLSLKYGVQLDPSNLDQFKNYLNPQIKTATSNIGNQGTITLINDDGDSLNIDANDEQAIQDAIYDGYHE